MDENKKPTKEHLEHLIGMQEMEAERVINSWGFYSRVVRRNGHSYLITKDYDIKRINLEIDFGLVIQSYVG